MVFEKSLNDVVRGLRQPRTDEAAFAAQVIAECREEVRSPDIDKKHNAIQKLFYLQMFGYDMSWAAFHIVEVMSAKRFVHKRMGYLAAAQSFHAGTDVLMLCTALIRKDMMSPQVYEAGLALNTLAHVATHDLARDLAGDLVSMLNASRPYVRKRTALVMYKVFLKYPDALRPSFPRLREKLDDPDAGVQAAAVSVVCELARKNPKNYISLAPALYKIMTTSQNNWVLIKIVKLFAAMMPAEPRLAKKLMGPITHIINTTPAMSLLYECIQTCTSGLAEHMPTIKLCVTKLRPFVEDSDQNLKYLGLAALENIMKIQPRLVAEHREIIIGCLDDPDVSLRHRALALLGGLVTKRNVQDIIQTLLMHVKRADSSAYKDTLVEKVVSICSDNTYAHVGAEFEWYLMVLMELAHAGPGLTRGRLVSAQMQDVIIRVQVVRSFAVKHMLSLLREATLFAEHPEEDGPCEVLYAAAWCVGEYAREHIANPIPVIEALLQPGLARLPHRIQSVYMQSVLKLFAHALAKVAGAVDSGDAAKREVAEQKIQEVVQAMRVRLPVFAQSQHLEVQERACFSLELLNIFDDVVAGKDIAARPMEEVQTASTGTSPTDAQATEIAEAKNDNDSPKNETNGGEADSLIALSDDGDSGSDNAKQTEWANDGVAESQTNEDVTTDAAGSDSAPTSPAPQKKAAASIEPAPPVRTHEPVILDTATAYRVLATELLALFDEPLNPVAARAQKKVPVPDDLDLDAWIHEPPEEDAVAEDDYYAQYNEFGRNASGALFEDNRFADIMSEDEDMFGSPMKATETAAREASAAANKARRGGAFYLSGGDESDPEHMRARMLREERGYFSSSPVRSSLTDDDLPPVQNLDLSGAPGITKYDARQAYASAMQHSRERRGSGRGLRGSRGGRGGRGGHGVSMSAPNTPVIIAAEEFPEGASDSDDDAHKTTGDIENEMDADSRALAAVDFSKEADVSDLPSAHLKHREVKQGIPQISAATSNAPAMRGARGRGTARGGARGKVRGRGGVARSSAAALAPTAPITAASPAKSVPRYRPLCQDGALAAIVELRSSLAEPNKILAALALKNISKDVTVTDVSFEFSALPAKIAFDSAGAKSAVKLNHGQTGQHTLVFSGFDAPQQFSISGCLNYAADSERRSQQFNLSIAPSAFLVPHPLAKAQFMALLKGQFKDDSGAPVRMAGTAQQTVAKVSDAGFDSMCVYISRALRCELVLLDATAAFFARTAQGGYVALHAKLADSGVILSIKSSDASTAQALAAEAASL